MELFYLEKLMEEAHIADKIADGIVDDAAYNAVTQTINESVILEAQYEAEEVLSHGKDLRGDINLADLQKEINSAFGLTESVSDINSDKLTEDTNMKAKLENAANPSADIDTADAFLNAPAIKQKDFVTAKTASKVSTEMAAANTNTEDVVTVQPNDTNVEKQADKVMGSMQKGAEANKKWMAVAKTVTENAGKFTSFVESLKDESNAELLEAVLQAFKVAIPVLENEEPAVLAVTGDAIQALADKLGGEVEELKKMDPKVVAELCRIAGVAAI